MLSQHLSNFTDCRSDLYRRRQAKPKTLESQTVPAFPATVGFYKQGSHQMNPRVPYPMSQQEQQQQVGITNQGHSQHHLQVAQQQSQARPGPHHRDVSNLQLSEQEFRNLQHQQLDAQIDSLIHGNSYGDSGGIEDIPGQHYVKIERSRSHPGSQTGSDLGSGFPGHVFTAAGFEQAQYHGQNARYPERPTSSQSMCGPDTKMSFSLDPIWQLQRPFTPPNQSILGYAPITPATTPYSRPHIDRSEISNHYDEIQDFDCKATIRPSVRGSPVRTRPQSEFVEARGPFQHHDPNATIKPSKRPKSLNSSFLEEPSSPGKSDQGNLPSPPCTASFSDRAKFDVAKLPDVSSMESFPSILIPPGDDMVMDLMRQDQKVISYDPSPSSPRTPVLMQKQRSRAGTASLHSARSSVDFGNLESPSRILCSPTKMSFGDLTLDAMVEETGVSAEEVQGYITEDASNAKLPFGCIYPDCGKKFGRKENIRSHVQTHLNDRRFKCIHCSKRFVRQHDLKRHAKIHSGTKPYLCACGRDFARHDALTRHRQRGICAGGFEGVVRKPVKRGRPRKQRPNPEDRMDKATRTRQRTRDRTDTSSVSGTSESSFPESPSSIFCEDVEMSQAPEDIALLRAMNGEAVTFSSGTFSYTPPLSPYSTGNVGSPTKTPAARPESSPQDQPSDDFKLSEASSLPVTVSMANMDRKSQSNSQIESHSGSQQGSQPGSPPALSHSSPPSSGTLLDFDFGGSLQTDIDQEEQKTSPGDHNSSGLDLFSMENTQSSVDEAWNDDAFFSFEKCSANSHADFSSGFGDDPLFSDGI